MARASLQRCLVVGASLAGLRAVEALRRGGYEGALTLVGAEERLPYDRPPLSKEILAGAWETERAVLRSPESYAELDVELRLGRAAAALELRERRVRLVDGEVLPFDGLIIATGAAPRTLPDTPALAGIYTLRTLDDCLALRREFEAGPRLVVVGAGFIGSEVAATARGRGLEVTVLEALPAPLVRGLGEEMGAACAQLHWDHGVDLRCGVQVAGMDGSERVERVQLADGTAVAADVVVVGVGVTPNTGWLESSGLELRDGVVCDANCAAAPGVYAAGDVARWYNPLFEETMRVEHWTNAGEQAAAAAANLLAGAEGAQPFAPVPFVWSDQYDTKIQFVGQARPGDEVRVVEGTVAENRFVAIYGRGGRIVAALTFNWPRRLLDYRMRVAQRGSWEEALNQAGVADSGDGDGARAG